MYDFFLAFYSLLQEESIRILHFRADPMGITHVPFMTTSMLKSSVMRGKRGKKEVFQNWQKDDSRGNDETKTQWIILEKEMDSWFSVGFDFLRSPYSLHWELKSDKGMRTMCRQNKFDSATEAFTSCLRGVEDRSLGLKQSPLKRKISKHCNVEFTLESPDCCSILWWSQAMVV